MYAEMRGLGPETTLNERAKTLGQISPYGLLILVVISVVTFNSDNLLKWTHKTMSVVFVAGSFHFFFIMKPFAMTDPAGLYTDAFCVAGLAAYLWMLVPDTMRPSKADAITNFEDTGRAQTTTLRPVGKPLKVAPGQFGALKFTGSGDGEPHPFTFSGIGAEGTHRVTVKALGALF